MDIQQEKFIQSNSVLTANTNFQQCKRCLLDTTVSSIRFNEQGICNFCESHNQLETYFPSDSSAKEKLENIVQKIKSDGQGKEYDCIVGVSGGTDSSYVLFLAKKLGLRPLAVHFDNGWNTDESVTNIKNIINKLNVDLYTYVVDWEEFKSLQIAFLKAAVPCIEAPTDVGIHGTLMKMAKKFGVKYILGGQSFKTEGTVPKVWSYLDGTYIQTINKLFGTTKLKSFPNLSLFSIFYYTFIKGIRQVPVLNYIDYDKTKAKAELAFEFGWKDYGGHHYENIYSKFAFGWYLPRKFNIDKRKVSLSGPIRSNLIKKEDAQKLIENLPDIDPQLIEYTYKKLGLSKDEFYSYFNSQNKSYKDYYTSETILKYFRIPILISVKLGILTPVLYEKYFKT